jgi:hypothetical protein
MAAWASFETERSRVAARESREWRAGASGNQLRSNPRFNSQSVTLRSYSNCSHSAVWR